MRMRMRMRMRESWIVSVFILHLHEWHTRNHILSCGGFLEVEIIIDNI